MLIKLYSLNKIYKHSWNRVLFLFTIVLLFFSSAQLSAQNITLLGSTTASAKGSGTAGKPTLTWNIPAGNSRIMIVTFFFERMMASPNVGNNWPSTNSGADFFNVQVGGFNMTGRSALRSQYSVNNTATFTNSDFGTDTFIYSLRDVGGLPTGNTTFDFSAILNPKFSSDEVLVSIEVYGNVGSTILTGTNTLGYAGFDLVTPYDNSSSTMTVSNSGFTLPIGRTASELLYSSYGMTTKDQAQTVNSGWTVVNNFKITNADNTGTTGWPFDRPLNEGDGINFISAYQTNVANPSNFTVTRSPSSDTERIHAIRMQSFALAPLAKPSVSGTVFLDTNGPANIGGTGTNGGGLFINVVDAAGNVVYVATVAANGTYTIPTGNVVEDSIYKFQLSKTAGTVNSTPPPIQLNPGYLIVGEATNPTGNDGLADGMISDKIGTSNLSGYNFGINTCTPTAISAQPQVTQTVCKNAAPTNLSVTGSGASLTYQWYSNPTDTNAGGTSIAGATSSTYTPPTTTPGTTFYYAIVTGTCGQATSNTSRVIVSDLTAVSGQPLATQTVVQNTSSTTFSVLARGLGLTYQWYSNATNSTTGGTIISGATSSFYIAPTSVVGTRYYYAVITGTCGNATSATAAVIVTAACTAGTMAPVLTTNATGTAPSVDLSSLVSSTTPTNSVLEWHTVSAPVDTTTKLASNTVTSTTTLTNYYGVYHSTSGTNCYSPSAKVSVIGNTCPATTVDISTVTNSTIPAGNNSVRWFTNSAGTGTALTNAQLQAAGAGTYWPFFYDATNMCYSNAGSPVVVSIRNCTIDAVNDINQVPKGVTAIGSVLTNDESLSGPITVQSATYLNSAGVLTALPLGTATNVYDAAGTLAGSMTLRADGTYTFVPTATYVGKVPVNYVAVDANGNTDPAQLTIIVIKTVSTNSNNNPIAQNDTGYTEINTAVSSNVLVNDSDPDGNTLTVTGATQGGTALTIGTSTTVSGVNSAGVAVANAGTIVLNANGTYTYTPATGFVGTVNPIPYSISDGNGGTATAVLNLKVLPNVGNQTFANDDANTGKIGTTLTGNVKTNDTDPEGNPTTVTGATYLNSAGVVTALPIGTATNVYNATGTLAGSMMLNANGTYTFVPTATYTGTTPIIYTVCDTVGLPQACDTATLYLTELPNSNIDAVNDINQVPKGITATGSVLTNDESTSNPITVQSATYLNAAGVVTVLPLGTATNVYDAAGTLAGSMTLNADGTYTFVPTATYVGKVPVNYVAVNTVGSTDPATLTIVVIENPAGGNDNPIAQNDTGYTEINTPVSSNVLLNDSDPNVGTTLTVTGATQGGTTLTIGTATTVSGVNSSGVTVANAGTVTLNANGTYTYTPANGFVGTVNPIPYTISDGNGGTATAVLNLKVLPNVGNETFANDDANTGIKGTTLTGNVKTNDTDPEGNPTTVTAANVGGTTLTIGTATVLPGVGTLTLNAIGTYTFVPLATYVGTTSVIYTVCDNQNPQACDTATLYLTELPLGVCYELPNTTGTAIDTKHGITLLQRAGADNGNWPMVRKSAHTVLESNTKGFVITRMSTVDIQGQTSPAIAAKITNPQEGMMVYDTTVNCLKLYANGVWSCFSTPTCP
ncbi:beta strand repeat-containing protein [Frigoriflavimonas asaccharolytica]|uniref:CshA-type fibril repeat protein n=1 Tax=Frigoriflavimonas asaccharolytica TaxID=2735899 RepID=A0A8J8K9S1_9FLAO|nr:cadherin-like domain-containing protein [Frigoriflavimonas asaccharolytica]NRS93961.1 CshA-type fibril repeat protein [Frigoriflavimonas asaccharolytica]